MRQRKLIDVSMMDIGLQRHSSLSPDGKKRNSSKRNSIASYVTSGRSQSLSLSTDFRPRTASIRVSTPCGSSYNPLSLTTNGRSLESAPPSNGGSRLTSGVSRVTLSSRSTARSRRKMTSTTSSQRTTTACSKNLFPENVGSQLGITVWVLEKGRLTLVNYNSHGFFHQGNGYLIMKIQSDESKSLHVWLGSKADPADRDILLCHANSLDKLIEGANFLSVENEGHETGTFLEHFQDGLVVVEGKSKTSLRSATVYKKRLYIVKGRRFPIATCTPCTLSALASDRALILDGFPRIYVWLGPDVDNVTRVKAIQVASKIRNCQRRGIAHIIVVDKKDTSLHEAFMRKLDVDDVEDEELQLPQEDARIPQLYKINGDRPLYDMPFVAEKPLQHKYLTSKDCFLLDRGPHQPVFIWIGGNTDKTALYGALRRAQNFTHHCNYPTKTALCRLTEGDEPPCFKAAFSDWNDRTTKQRQLIRSYNASNIGRALYSSSDCRTIAQMSELWSEDQFVSGDGMTEVWRISNISFQAEVWEKHGIFNNHYSFVILYQESSSNQEGNKNIVYYWLGSKSTAESQKSAITMVSALNRALEQKTSVVRVLDGMEPKHFLTIFRYSMLVYDGDLVQGETANNHTKRDLEDIEQNSNEDTRNKENNSINMFRVQEGVQGCMKVLQVSPLSTSLNSSAAYIIYSDSCGFVWYGKNASANEREYSKSMIDNLCPDRLHQYDIVAEGREPNKFWDLLTRNGDYQAEFPKQLLQRRPPQLFLYFETSCTFWNIEQFSQEDLNESDIYILDTFDQLFLWCGKDYAIWNCELFLTICENYLEADLANRHMDNIQIWYVNQGFEPDVFIKHFPTWHDIGYGGKNAFETARKWTRQENATIDIDCQMIDRAYTFSVKLPYKELVKRTDLEGNIDIHHKEHHLTDKEFNRLFRMTRGQFYRLPDWKQYQILRSLHLRQEHDSSDDMHPAFSIGSAGSHLSMNLNSAMRKKIQALPLNSHDS